jgi:NTP pyrophosphatase (non-canonical NTP hydrolase)
MELSRLSDRAMQIHQAFSDRARRDGGHPWTREEIMSGFVGDVGDLMKLTMARAGARPGPGDLDARLAHELSDCLWSVLVLARLHGVDLEPAYLRTMDEIAGRLGAK